MTGHHQQRHHLGLEEQTAFKIKGFRAFRAAGNVGCIGPGDEVSKQGWSWNLRGLQLTAGDTRGGELSKNFYFNPTTIAFPPANGSMFVSRNPASRIQPTQSAPL
jgi:hypothetical protein